jgi:DNA modification methylase
MVRGKAKKTKAEATAYEPPALRHAELPGSLQIEVVPLEQLKPYARNARIHSPDQIKQIAASIAQFGFINPVLVDANLEIVAGHGRVEAARHLQLEAVPVFRLGHLSVDEARALRLADNKIASNSKWDADLLALELAGLKELGNVDGVHLADLTGFDIREMRSLMGNLAHNSPNGDEDEAPDQPAIPRTIAGDLYEIGPHRLMCGSAIIEDDVRTLMDGKEGEMIFTDPPYNVAYVGKTKDALTIQNDKMDGDAFLQFLRIAYLNLALCVSKGGAIYVAHVDTEGMRFRQAFIEAGFKLSGCLVWVKPSMVLGRSDYQWRHEPILYGWKEGASHRWQGDRKQTTVWEVDRPSRSSEHPTMKPVALIDIALNNSTRPGDLVVDLFGGSGSTMVAAHKGGRIANLMELDEKYCDVIVTRMHKLWPALPITCNGKPVKWLDS